MLELCARHGRALLVLGLLVGIALPALAEALADWIVPLIAGSLFVAGLRVGPAGAFPPARALPRALALVALLQCALPLALGAVLLALGLLNSVGGTGAVLVLAGAPITGIVGLALMSGAAPAIALRQLILGTALLPLTAAPVFALLPLFGDARAVAGGALRLLLVIALAWGLAMLLRRAWPALRREAARPALDGAMALAMALVVVGLMSAVGPAILSADPALPFLLALAFALNLVPALLLFWAARRALPAPEAAGLAIAGSNRNLALFLAALPAAQTDTLLLFVGAYQVPMYLSPLILPPLFARLARRG